MISFKALITAGLLIIGTYLLVSQQINVGQFIASDIVIISVMNSVEKLMLSLENIYETLVSNDKLTKILEMESDPTIGFQFNEQSVKQFQLDVRNLSYRFEDTTEILHRLNFSVKAVQLVLLRGSSGSGKSLLLKILLGIYREHKGSLLLNGMELSNYDIYSVRQHIGVYFGLNEIVEGSLYDNIVMENKNIPLSHIHDMANITGLSDDLLHYKIDFNDTISIYQMHLSKSIRSKILLTRLLVGGQKILFLEDAFKFLDKQETKRLFDYWRKNKYTILCTTDDNDYDTFFDQVYNLNPSGEEIESV
jgi:ATP-binding cassette, subfamily B, bacterial